MEKMENVIKELPILKALCMLQFSSVQSLSRVRGPRVQSLVRELRSQMPCTEAEKKRNQNVNPVDSLESQIKGMKEKICLLWGS